MGPEEDQRSPREAKVHAGMFLSAGKTMRGAHGSEGGESTVNQIDNSLPGRF